MPGWPASAGPRVRVSVTVGKRRFTFNSNRLPVGLLHNGVSSIYFLLGIAPVLVALWIEVAAGRAARLPGLANSMSTKSS